MTNLKRPFFALIILVLFSQSTFAKDDYDHNFSDTANTDWNLPVGFIFNKGIVEGYADGTFRPFQTINRAELLKIILESVYENISDNAGANCGFYDVVPEEWYAKYVCFAKDEGIVKGYQDGSFQPSRAVSFVEALKITSLAYEWNVEEPADEWYGNYVKMAEAKNLIPVYIQAFNEELNRGNMADMITRFIKEKEGKLGEYLGLVNLSEVHVTYDCLKSGQCPVANEGSYDEGGNALDAFETFQKNTLASGLHQEKIVFAVEEGFAAKHPDWKENAGEIISYVNDVLAKNTKLRFEIEKYMTFAEEDRYPELSTNADYHIINEDYCSLTFAYYPYEELTPSLQEDERYSTALFSDIEGKNCVTVYVANEIEYDELNGKKYFQDKWGFENNNSASNLPDWENYYRSAFYTVLHEMGHGLGLASPEWYFYKFEDQTGEDPILEKYDFAEMFPNELMGASISLMDVEFSPLAAYIIDHNLDHRFTLHEIANFFPEKVVIRVEDENGEAVSGADVKIYAGLKGCWYCNTDNSKYGLDENGSNILLESLTTDDNGEIEIDGPKNSWSFEEVDSTPYIGLIVKANDGNLKGAAYVTAFDMQKSKIMTGEDVYYVDVIVE